MKIHWVERNTKYLRLHYEWSRKCHFSITAIILYKTYLFYESKYKNVGVLPKYGIRHGLTFRAKHFVRTWADVSYKNPKYKTDSPNTNSYDNALFSK